jgi:hypothetical protein
MGDQPLQGLRLQDAIQMQHEYSLQPPVALERTVPVFMRAKMFHALDHVAFLITGDFISNQLH